MKTFALVTGGSRGIGAAICKRLAKDGYHVLINFRSNIEAAKETAAIVEAEGKEAHLLQCDVSDKSSFEATFENWKSENEDAEVEILVNNAGQRIDQLFMWMEDENWKNVLDTHVGGFYNVTKTIYPLMVRQRYGRIINIVSLSGLKGIGWTNQLFCSKSSNYWRN